MCSADIFRLGGILSCVFLGGWIDVFCMDGEMLKIAEIECSVAVSWKFDLTDNREGISMGMGVVLV